MNIKQFIEKAIEGGWNGASLDDGVWFGCRTFKVDGSMDSRLHIRAVLLDPLAWKAVGKVEGWPENDDIVHGNWDEPATITHEIVPYWLVKMHRLIDALAEGKTIEEFLETL